MVDPPFEAGAVKAIEAEALPAVAAPMVGAPGTVATVGGVGVVGVVAADPPSPPQLASPAARHAATKPPNENRKVFTWVVEDFEIITVLSEGRLARRRLISRSS
jgi:hypothetical protein